MWNFIGMKVSTKILSSFKKFSFFFYRHINKLPLLKFSVIIEDWYVIQGDVTVCKWLKNNEYYELIKTHGKYT